ncbi:hypothetical protein [Lederbergia citrea]|uniref:hypothetical protein n=1 Tax=Lederbergia citrea TaxID=2833581 RepID=UPI001BCA035C|nr:hypothetical protein [Lederbergia citrea]MBS4203432.1 hypothetical protein [Lederbergia citrea]
MPSNEREDIKIIKKPKSITPLSNEKRENNFKAFCSPFVFKYRNSLPIDTKNNPIPIPIKSHIGTPRKIISPP